jgi:predicted RNA-binding protein YlqC (UPF0109 family)
MTDAPEDAPQPDDATDGGPSADSARSVLEYLVRSVVDDPDGVQVEVTEGRRNEVSLDVRVADGDMGRVIGKRGRIAQAIRTVVRAAAARDGVTVDIEFLE